MTIKDESCNVISVTVVHTGPDYQVCKAAVLGTSTVAESGVTAATVLTADVADMGLEMAAGVDQASTVVKRGQGRGSAKGQKTVSS
jgi:hypothetical protein